MPESRSAKRLRCQKGSTLVEFSLVLIPLLGLLMLTLDLAWVLFTWVCIQEGAREGVRSAITGQTDASIAATVQQYSFGLAKNTPGVTPIQVFYYSASNPALSLTGIGSSCSGNIVKVIVSGINIAPIMPVWRTKSPIVLSAAAADLVESNSRCR